MYITEQAHFMPVASPDTDVNVNSWARPTLKIMPQSFATNFDLNKFNNNLTPTGLPAENKNSWTADTGKILYGETIAQLTSGDGQHPQGNDYWTNASDGRHGTYFQDYGGSNMILPQIQWKKRAGDTEYFMCPVVRTMEIFIPRGVYGIGQLGQLIEDYFNGIVSVGLVNGNRVIERKTDIEKKIEQIADNFTDTTNPLIDQFDGQIFNSPTIQRTFVRNDRRFLADGEENPNTINAETTKPVYEFSDIGMDGFTSMDCFNELLAFTQKNNYPNIAPALNNQFNWTDCKDLGDAHAGAYIDYPTHAKRRPFYYFVAPEDEGSVGTKPPPAHNPNHVGAGADNVESLYGYGLNGYSDVNRDWITLTGNSANYFQTPYNTSRYLNNQSLFTRMIGTSNFSFEYNTEQNGYEMKGLHQVPIAPSHDGLGIKNSSAGNQVINVKQLIGNSLRRTPETSTIAKHYNGLAPADPNYATTNNKGYFSNPKTTKLIRGLLNTPETRTSGIMITNFALETSINNRSVAVEGTDVGKNFRDYFNSDKEARQHWKSTIWFKLGFDYDQIANRDKFKKQNIYNKDFKNNVYYNTPNANQNCGFTTDTAIDNSIITTISTLNNPYEIAEKKILPDKSNPAETNFQIFGLGAVSRPWDVYNATKAIGSICSINQFSNSLYKACSCIPVSIADVGGITANRLPTLTQQSYYLITSDILDNFKDNVKKGEPLALMGVVAKTNLSNQDFIVDKNDITQILSQSKVVNKIRIKVLNPNLTTPILDDSSSILIKITKPNIIPTTLLPPKEIKVIAGEVQTF